MGFLCLAVLMLSVSSLAVAQCSNQWSMPASNILSVDTSMSMNGGECIAFDLGPNAVGNFVTIDFNMVNVWFSVFSCGGSATVGPPHFSFSNGDQTFTCDADSYRVTFQAVQEQIILQNLHQSCGVHMTGAVYVNSMDGDLTNGCWIGPICDSSGTESSDGGLSYCCARFPCSDQNINSVNNQPSCSCSGCSGTLPTTPLPRPATQPQPPQTTVTPPPHRNPTTEQPTARPTSPDSADNGCCVSQCGSAEDVCAGQCVGGIQQCDCGCSSSGALASHKHLILLIGGCAAGGIAVMTGGYLLAMRFLKARKERVKHRRANFPSGDAEEEAYASDESLLDEEGEEPRNEEL